MSSQQVRSVVPGLGWDSSRCTLFLVAAKALPALLPTATLCNVDAGVSNFLLWRESGLYLKNTFFGGGIAGVVHSIAFSMTAAA